MVTGKVRRNASMRTIGVVLGEKLRLQTWERINAADCRQPDDVLWWGDLRMVLDRGNMPPRLVRLIPRGYAVCPAVAWSDFVQWASALGEFK